MAIFTCRSNNSHRLWDDLHKTVAIICGVLNGWYKCELERNMPVERHFSTSHAIVACISPANERIAVRESLDRTHSDGMNIRGVPIFPHESRCLRLCQKIELVFRRATRCPF